MKTRSGLLIIGEELLNGAHPDINGPVASRFLLQQGFRVELVQVCGDSLEEIQEALERFPEDIPLIFTSGGLGGTRDDVTLQALSEWSGQNLNDDNADIMRLKNPVGRCPATVFKHKGHLVITFPGVPKEFRSLMSNELSQVIREYFQLEKVYQHSRVNIARLSETEIDNALGDIGDPHGNPKVGLSLKEGYIQIHLTAESATMKEAQQLLTDKKNQIRQALGDHVFGHDSDTPQSVVANILSEQSWTIATAESCTGGLIANLLTDVPGSSAYYKQGYVTYAVESKVSELGLNEDLIYKEGVVSKAVAIAMAEACREKSSADIAIGITGNAGPSSGDGSSPVGLVHMAVASKNDTWHEKHRFTGLRNNVKLKAAKTCLDMIRRFLIKHAT